MAPIINNLNEVLLVREDEAVDRTVLALAKFDSAAYPSVRYTLTAAPSYATDLFYILCTAAIFFFLIDLYIS